MTQQMDEIDQKQQKEIDRNSAWIKVVSVLSTILTIAAIAIFMLLVENMKCPHSDCPHHITQEK